MWPRLESWWPGSTVHSPIHYANGPTRGNSWPGSRIILRGLQVSGTARWEEAHITSNIFLPFIVLLFLPVQLLIYSIPFDMFLNISAFLFWGFFIISFRILIYWERIAAIIVVRTLESAFMSEAEGGRLSLLGCVTQPSCSKLQGFIQRNWEVSFLLWVWDVSHSTAWSWTWS